MQPGRASLPDNRMLHASRSTSYAGCYAWGLLQLGVQVARGAAAGVQPLPLHDRCTLPIAWLTSHLLLQVKQRLAAAIKAFLHLDSNGPECQEHHAPPDGGQEALGSNFAERNRVRPGEEDGM